MTASLAKRPSAELGTYTYWRWELRDFWILMDTETDVQRLELAYQGLMLVAVRTHPDDPMEEIVLAADITAARLRFERAHLAAMMRVEDG